MIPQRVRVVRRSGRAAVIAAVGALAAVLTLSSGVAARGDDEKTAKKPSLAVKVNPVIAFAPATVFASAELKGGRDDDEEFYCASVQWEWGDDTTSESTYDCEPYEAGKSEVRRRFSNEHTYTMPGNFRVRMRLRKGTRVLTAASATVQVRPGMPSEP
jgi:hypothetical protein